MAAKTKAKKPATTLFQQELNSAAGTGTGANPASVMPPAQYGPTGYESYSTTQYGTPTQPNFDWTIGTNTPLGNYFSQDPTTMASAWGLPTGSQYLQVSSGFGTQTKPATAGADTSVQRGVAMTSLYMAFRSQKPLSTAELKAARALGGTIAHAAEMLGTHRHKLSAQAEQALVKASKEISTKLEGTLGLKVADLTTNGLGTKISSQFSNVLNNAGYSVNQTMTLGQVLGLVSGPNAEQPSTTIKAPQTVGSYIRSLTNGQMTATDIYNLQVALWNGGFFGDAYTSGQKSFTKGNLTTATLQAFRSAVVLAGQQNAQHPTKPVSLAQVIQTGDQQNSSLLQAIGNSTKLSTTPFSYATATQLQGTLESAMASYLGRSPTKGELQSFTSYLDTLERAGNKQVQASESPMGIVDYSTGVPFLPKVPTPAQAAETWVQNTDPTAYHAHGIANAFGELMNLIDRQSVSAYTTVGTRPTTTT